MRLRTLGLFLLASTAAMANSAGPPAGLSGAPGDSSCSGCHGNGTVNTGPGRLTVTVDGGANTYTPGQVLKLKITLTDPNARRWGFQMTARSGADNRTPAGSFAPIAGDNKTRVPDGNVNYIEHSSAGTALGTTGSNSWEVNWTAPIQSVGAVTFFAAGNAANGNSSDGVGDVIYTATLTIQPATPGGGAITVGNRVMPQLVFGGGWATTLYFGNTTAAAQTLTLRFYDTAGLPLPVAGAPTSTLNIQPGGAVAFVAPNSGALIQGWATFDLPDGVTGYGVFRQSVLGRIDQEALVDFSRTNATKAVIVWDERGTLRTGVSLVNPSNVQVTASVNIKDSNGVSIISGPLPTPLPPGGKTSFVVRDLIPGVVGKFGTAEITVAGSGGAGAMVALRFDDAGAITTIPVQQN